MGGSESKESRKTKELAIEGVQFEPVNNKCLRLYFESQFYPAMEEHELSYLSHLFELKVKLYFDRHYQSSNLIDIEEFTNKQKDTILTDINREKYRECSNLQIQIGKESDSYFLNNFELINDTLIFNRSLKVLSTSTLNSPLQIESTYLRKIEQIRVLKIYIKYNTNTDNLWFLLNNIMDSKCKNLRKIVIYQTYFATPDEEMFNLLAYFVSRHPLIEAVKIKAKNDKTEEDEEDDDDEENEEDDEEGDEKNKNQEDVQNQTQNNEKNKVDDLEDNEENKLIVKNLSREFKKVDDIKNKQYLFCFYQILSKKNNLLELSTTLYIKEYGFVLLADVIVHNPNLQKITVRCMNSQLMGIEGGDREMNDTNLNQLEYTFATYNGFGEKIKDEIFIFFNYLMTLENLEVFKLTHFWFNSDLNFMSCELAKENPKLKELSLAYNQAVINNDEALLDSFSFSSTNLAKLDMGISYFHMIRRFDYLIGPNLLELNCGVLDFVSVISLMKYVKETNLRMLKCTLNKPCHFNSIDLLLQQIANNVITSPTLKRFEINNMYYFKNYNKSKKSLDKIIEIIWKFIMKKLSMNRVLRTLILSEKTKNSHYLFIKNFCYFPEKDHNKCYAMIKILNGLYKNKQFTKIPKKDIISRIVFFAHGKHRKVII